MKHQELRILNDAIGARLTRYGENQHARDDDCKGTQTGSDKVFTKTKKIKRKFSEDAFGHKDISNTKNVQVVHESDAGGIVSDYMKMDKRNQRVFHDIPSSSYSEPRTQYPSNVESKTFLPDTGLEFSRFGARPKVRKQDHQYSNSSFSQLDDDNFGTNPVSSSLRNKDGHLDNVKIEKASKIYKKPFVSSQHDSYNYSKDCGYKYEEENSSCSDSNFHSTMEHEYLQYDPRNVSNSNQYSEHSDNQIEQDVIHTVFIKGKGVVASKNQKRLEAEFSERRARNQNFDLDYESDGEYYNSYLDMKGNSQVYSKSKNIHNNSYVSKFPRFAANFIPDNSIQSSSKVYTRVGINDFPEISAGISLDNRSSISYSKQINNLNTDSHQFYDTSLYVNPDNIGSYANYCNENYAQVESNKNVKSRKRQAWVDEITPYETSNFENELISNKYRANTFSMHDACKVATLFRPPIHELWEHNLDIPVADGKNYYQTKRKCWAKTCWSLSGHSHASLSSKVELLSKERHAILNSMSTPHHATKSKKKTCSDCWSSCFKSSFSRLQLWNSTLKKIEGQFGTGVVSYFVFLRWLIILNFGIFILYFLLIILPYSAFSLLPQRNIKIAPNTTLVTDEYLQRFPKYENVDFMKKTTSFENVSFDIDGDLLGNLGTLLDNYLPDEILDVTLRYDKKNFTGEQRRRNSLFCAERYEKEMANRTNDILSYLQDFLQGTGWLQSTILFLGSYPDRDVSYFGLPYNLPVSFLMALFASFFLSLVLMLKFSSHGVQENILTRKSNYLTFSNILFCSWDYCIEDHKSAKIRHKSITGELKSNLSEERRRSEVRSWSTKMKIKVYMLRAFSHILVLISLFGCFYLIYRVVNFQLEKQRQNALTDGGVYTLFIQFLSPLVITGLNIIMPIVFNNMVKFEMYDSRTQINMALFRVVFLRLASLFVLVSSVYQQITCEPKDNCKAGLSEYCRSPLCWETYVGQQLYKLIITDFLVYICMYLGYDLPRDLIVRNCKCKVTEVIGRQEFDLPSQVLSLVYSQTLCWLGVFYSPLLSLITVLKFFVVFYIKKDVVLRHCVPAPTLYKASRSNYIFMMILLLSFFFVTVTHGYSLASIEPSPGCSPFRQYNVIISAIPDAIFDWSPGLVSFLSFLFSGFFFIPSFIVLSIIIYYYWTVVVAQREMTKVLKAQIAIEGRDKQFLLNRLAGVAREAAYMEAK